MSSEAKHTIRGGEFIIADQSLESFFVPEQANEEQRMIIQTVSDFVKEIGDRANQLEEQPKLLEEAADLGLLGAHIPEAYGGMELKTNTNTLLLEELGKAGGSFDTSFAAHTGIGMLPILYFGTEEQKNKYLPKMASGEWKASYCLTEPGAGSDALAAKTKATLTEDGKHYLIEGQKMWISNAGFADVFIVFAKVDGEKFTGFIVDAHSDNIKLGAEEIKMGIKGSSTRQVFFEGTKVPVENVLGEIGKGHLIAFNVLNIGRFKLGTLAVGGAKEAIDFSIKYANERHQFGQAISGFGAIKYKIAEMTIRTFVNESINYRISDLLQDFKDELTEGGKSFEQALLESAEEYAIECAITKVAGSECVSYVVDEALQIFGGYGFSEEYPAAQAYRDSRINRIYEGTNEINRLLMVNMLLKKAMKGQLDLVGPAWEVQKELAKMPSFSSDDGDYADQIKAVKNYKKIALMVAGAAAKYQMDGKIDLKNEQEVLMNVADIMIEIYATESILLRVQKLEEIGHFANKDVYNAIMDVYITDAQARIGKSATDALSSFATGDEQKIMINGLKRFMSYPIVNVKEKRRIVADHMIEQNGYSL